MCYQTERRFLILLKEAFLSSIAFAVINICGKGESLETATVFRMVYHVVC